MRTKIIVALSIAILGLGYYTIRQRDARIRREAIASDRIKSDSIKLIAYRDSLSTTKEALRKALHDVGASFAAYDSVRQQQKRRIVVVYDTIPGTNTIDTLRLAAVDTQFVAKADSVRRSCGLLALDCASFRAYADSVIRFEHNTAQNYKILYEKSNKSCVNESIIAGSVGLIGGLFIGKKQ